MPDDRSTRLQDLFHRALEQAPEARTAWLAAACAEDAALRADVASLLAAFSGADERLAWFEDPTLAFAPPPDPLAGDGVEGYELLRELGRGGMGVVYLARDLLLDRPVALKLLTGPAASSPDRSDVLLAEARAAAALDHPHIATIYDVGTTTAGHRFLAMAYCDGGTLKERLEEGPLPADEALRVAGCLADALAAAHDRGIVHCDVKPANVLFTADGAPRLVDFGVARLVQAGAGGAVRGGGTYRYMAPEHRLHGAVDHRADVWSLGALLFEMLTATPYEAAGTPQGGPLSSPGAEHAADRLDAAMQLTPELRDLLRPALAPAPEERYARMADFRSALQHALRQRAERRAERASPASVSCAPLPVPLHALVGRARESAALVALVHAHRLVTLTGPGGTGKTRLALHVAHEVQAGFPDGVHFVSLAPLSEPRLFLPTLAHALALRERPGEAPGEALSAHLAPRRSLLVLDNFEQIVEAAAELVALLEACPRLRVLVTSRVPLRVRGERLFSVPPLRAPDLDALPPPAELARCEAVAFFLQCARSLRPSFELSPENAADVAEICVRLDGLPLAIELAAARIAVLSPAAMVKRLERRLQLLVGGSRDLPDRHRALREAIGWSYHLLDRPQQRLFRWLSVFAGVFTWSQIESLAATFADDEYALVDDLQALVDSHLVRRVEGDEAGGEPRFQLLETIREFARECLTGSGEEERAVRAHAACTIARVEEAEPWLTGPRPDQGLSVLDALQEDLRAVFQALLGPGGDHGAAMQTAAMLWRYWLMRGRLSEGRELLERLLLEAGADVSPCLHARLLTGAGTLAHNQGDYVLARSHYEAALTIYRTLADERGVALLLNHLGWVAWRLGDFGRARALSEESAALNRALGDARGQALALNNLGWVALFQGHYPAADAWITESLALQRQVRDQRGVAFAQTVLAWITVERGVHDEARRLIDEGVAALEGMGDRQLSFFARAIRGRIDYRAGVYDVAGGELSARVLPGFREIGDRWGIAFALEQLAHVRAAEARASEARRLLGECLELRRVLGDRWGVARCHLALGELELQAGRTAAAAEQLAAGLALAVELEDDAALTTGLDGFAALFLEHGDATRAANLQGAADALLEERAARRPRPYEERRQRRLEELARALGAAALAGALDAGRAQGRDAARPCLEAPIA